MRSVNASGDLCFILTITDFLHKALVNLLSVERKCSQCDCEAQWKNTFKPYVGGDCEELLWKWSGWNLCLLHIFCPINGNLQCRNVRKLWYPELRNTCKEKDYNFRQHHKLWITTDAKIMPVLESPCWYLCYRYMALKKCIHPQALNCTFPFA